MVHAQLDLSMGEANCWVVLFLSCDADVRWDDRLPGADAAHSGNGLGGGGEVV